MVRDKTPGGRPGGSVGEYEYGPGVRPGGSVVRYEVWFVIRCWEGDLVAVL